MRVGKLDFYTFAGLVSMLPQLCRFACIFFRLVRVSTKGSRAFKKPTEAAQACLRQRQCQCRAHGIAETKSAEPEAGDLLVELGVRTS